MSRRRRELRHAKRSEAAARALAALTRACDALDAWLTELIDILDVEDPSMEFEPLFSGFRSADQRVRGSLEQAVSDLHAAAAEAPVHLDANEAASLGAVYSMAREVRQGLDDELTGLDGDELDLELAKKTRSNLREAQGFIRQQLQRGAEVLQPIARLR